MLEIQFIDLSPAFDGEKGWISAQELDVIDPKCSRFQTTDDTWVLEGGAVFVFAYPISKDAQEEAENGNRN